MASKYHKAFQGFVKLFTGAKQPGVKGSSTTIIGVAPSKNIKKFQEQKEKILKTTDKYKSAVNDPEVKKVEKKAKGGRMGLKKGGGKFPDHSGDGKITQKDILMAKGVIPKTKSKKKVI